VLSFTAYPTHLVSPQEEHDVMSQAFTPEMKAAARQETQEAAEAGTLEKFVYDAIRLAGGQARSLTSAQRSRAQMAPTATTARGKKLGKWLMKGGDLPGERVERDSQPVASTSPKPSSKTQSNQKEEPVAATQEQEAQAPEVTPGKMETKYGAEIMARSKIASQNTPYTHATGPKDHARIDAAAKALLKSRGVEPNVEGIKSLIDSDGKVDKELLTELDGYSSGRTRESLQAWLTQLAA
jgi:hypothetical protein